MKLTDVLKKIAPTIATVLGGPLAGIAVEVIGEAVGMSEPTKEKVTEFLGNQNLTGEQIAAIKLAEKNLIFRLKELDIKIEELVVQDRISARALFEKGAKLIGVLATVTIVGFYGAIYYILSGRLKGMSPEELVIIGSVIGYLAANTQQVYNYFFGSSSSSDKKTDGLMGQITALRNGNGNGH